MYHFKMEDIHQETKLVVGSWEQQECSTTDKHVIQIGNFFVQLSTNV